MSNISRTSLGIKKTANNVTAAKGICPFTETPSSQRQQSVESVTVTGATELFSLFTADIIKAKTNFVR